MYRILIADDEGIMLEGLKSSILSGFGDNCIIETAKSGRIVIEKAESFHPDIIFMDIYMPGINGIQAIREIRKFNSSALFYVISAYDKFDYAKEAIDLGVESYLTKPVSKKKILSVVEEAMEKVDKKRAQRSSLLRIQEKLETVIPVVESSFVSSILFQNELKDAGYYRQLLDIEEPYAYVMVLQIGSEYENDRLLSPVKTNVSAQEFYPELRDEIKGYFSCCVGPLMASRITIIVPYGEKTVSYEERSNIVENARELIKRLESHIDGKFRIGIGRAYELESLALSYREAIGTMSSAKGRVLHADDQHQKGVYDEAFPGETERKLFRYMELGDTEEMLAQLDSFFDWIALNYPNEENNIRLKVLEHIIWAEKIAFQAGAINYGFSYRKDYLDNAMACRDLTELHQWFRDKMLSLCNMIKNHREKKVESSIDKAMSYIQKNFGKEISLDDVSREVNISPYYFSKLFKEQAGENFIEYLTRLRMDKAKEMLCDVQFSIKEISSACGYSDPNYFSRIFKKQTDMTPREYRMRYGE